jgi:hypothetical protein
VGRSLKRRLATVEKPRHECLGYRKRSNLS